MGPAGEQSEEALRLARSDGLARPLVLDLIGKDGIVEAETVATIILEWASVLDSVGPPPDSDDATAQRMGTALTDRLGWL